jgi:hypothetical protein
LRVSHLALLQGLGEVLQADPLAALGEHRGALDGLALLGDLRAVRSSGATMNVSPARGTAVRPSTMTGRDGVGLVDALPFSSSIARTRP